MIDEKRNCHFFEVWFNSFNDENKEKKDVEELEKRIMSLEKELFIIDLIRIVKNQEKIIEKYKRELLKFLDSLTISKLLEKE